VESKATLRTPKSKNLSDDMTLFDMEDADIARQLTLRSWAIYENIEVMFPFLVLKKEEKKNANVT